MSKKEYFAYGSNLNFEQMAYRCPEATVVGTAKLDGYELAFRRGYLTILPKEGASVEGLIWSVTDHDESQLDCYEGYPTFYVMNKEKTTEVSLEDAIGYAANRNKTEKSCYEAAFACTLESAFADMRKTKERWHKTGGVQGYHLVQSFATDEVTPELAHRIAQELADRVLGGRYEYITGTHLNTGHIHSHIVWNSVSRLDGKKYHSNGKSYVMEIRAVSDELCKKYGLSIIESSRADAVSKPYGDDCCRRSSRG